jgi:hypothetical protein
MGEKGFASVVLVVVICVAAIGGILYLRGKNLESEFSEPRSFIPSPSLTEAPTSETPFVAKSNFQKILQEKCVLYPDTIDGSSNSILATDLPINIDSSILANQEFNSQRSLGCFAGNTGLVETQLKEENDRANVSGAGDLFIYDQYSESAGTDTYSGTETYGTVFSETADTKIAAFFAFSQGEDYIGQFPIAINAQKKLTQKNGEVLFVKYTVIGIKNDDPRLISLSNKYSTIYDGEKILKSYVGIYEELERDMIQTFFKDRSSLQEPEKTAVARLESILSKITVK